MVWADCTLKAIFIIILFIGILGYAWYSDLLPFNAETSKGLSPSIEHLQQISNVLTSDKHQIIYYSFKEIPDIPDKQIPINALGKAIDTWEKYNPNLEFIESKNSNIEINWQKYASSTHTGLTTCNSVLFGILSHCILDISVGVEDCNSNFVQNDKNMIVNILMHEIGHALGLGHSSEENHLMYSTEFPEIPFNKKGYDIPERYEEFYVGQKLLIAQKKEIQSQIELLDTKISSEQLQYDEYYKQYEHYEGKTLPPKEYDKSQLIFEKINLQAEHVNALIDQQNDLINKINDILNHLGCNPNFEIIP